MYSQVKKHTTEGEAPTVTIVTSSQVSSDLPQFLARVASGEEFLIVDAGKELARIVPPASAENATTSHLPTVEEAHEEEHPWRGVFVPPRERRPASQFAFAAGAPALTRREPSPNFNFSRAEPDHA